MVSPAAGALEDVLTRAEPPREKTWRRVLRLGGEIADVLRRPGALVAAFDDLMIYAAELDLGDGLEGFADRLDTFRSIAELQGRDWALIRRQVTASLTVRAPDPGDGVSGGQFKQGTPLDEVLGYIHERLKSPPARRDYAVWVATLAGPSAEESPTVIGNGIAVCGVPCDGDVGRWLSKARDAFMAVYWERGEDPPADVAQLGTAWRLEGETVMERVDFWRSVASPSSFVSRVVVAAVSREEAHAEAHAALRAVFERSGRWIAQDIRPDSWLWTEEGGWTSSGASARDLALGELFAARTAGDAVSAWTADFSSPLRSGDIRLMQARALSTDPSAPSELRLMRATASLETFYRHDRIFAALDRLWLRWAWQTLRWHFDHLPWDIALGRWNADHPATRDGWTAVQSNRDALRVRLREGGMRYDRRLLSEIAAMLAPLDENTASRAWVRAFKDRLDDPGALRDARLAHAAACRRAQRHRNLVAHGWNISDEVLRSSADFMALHLELAIVAKAAVAPASGASPVLAGFDADPDEGWEHRTPGELLDAVAR
jgi:hypothetical protein